MKANAKHIANLAKHAAVVLFQQAKGKPSKAPKAKPADDFDDDDECVCPRCGKTGPSSAFGG